MAANTIDANFGVFLLAVTICETECKDSWGWFFRHLHEHLGHDDNRRISFITYRQKGVVDAIERWWPGSSNRFCVRHIFHGGNNSSDMVFKAAKSTNKANFDKTMKKMREANIDAYNYMSRIPVCHWSRHAFDPYVKSDHVTNNISECFNSWIDRFIGQPALTLLENLRRSFMKRFHKRLEEAKKWRIETPPGVWGKLTENQNHRRFLQVMCASDAEDEVK
ncbi:hypothetical protein ACOSP7_021851 [Xanthoceras sorbifolium]